MGPAYTLSQTTPNHAVSISAVLHGSSLATNLLTGDHTG